MAQIIRSLNLNIFQSKTSGLFYKNWPTLALSHVFPCQPLNFIISKLAAFRTSNYPSKVTELVQISAESVRIALFADETALHLHFPANQRLNDGNWNNLVITWTAHEGAYSLVWNAVRLYADKGYGKKKTVDINAWINLGHPLEGAATDPKFTGSITRVNMWTRVLDFEHDIPTIVQRCQTSPVGV